MPTIGIASEDRHVSNTTGQFMNSKTEQLWEALLVSAVIANIYMEEFEEQAITNATCKPKIWKRYVDDTFPVSDRDHVDDFLQHLNCQQSTIRFTMEIKKDNTIPFLDITVTRDSNGLVTTTVYRKPTHINQYIAYDSHHPQSVKRATVKCLYDRAKRLTTKASVISEKKRHLSSVLISNGYPSSFVRKLVKTARVTASKEPAQEFESIAVLPNINGVSEVFRRCLQHQGNKRRRCRLQDPMRMRQCVYR